jgi:CheY-like chemotaxis protein
MKSTDTNSKGRKRGTTHVLLVEDDSFDAQITAGILERKAGYAVTVASSGSEAIEMAKKIRPTIIVMDNSFPDASGPNGWEATEILRKTPETAHIPIILMTAGTLPDIEEAKRAGFNAIKPKPCPASELIPVIEGTLEEMK